MLPQVLEYDAETSQGKSLKLGPVQFDDSSFGVELKTAKSLAPGIEAQFDDANEMGLYFFWPNELIQSGTLEAIGRTGTVIWKYQITPEKLAEWQEQINEVRKEVGPKSNLLRSKFFKSEFALIKDINEADSLLKNGQTFKFCLRQEKGLSRTTVCSPRYGVKKDKKSTRLLRAKSDPNAQARVLVFNEQAPLKNVVELAPSNPVVFFAELKSGFSIEFTTLPYKLQIVDLVDNKKRPDHWTLTGVGTKPVGIVTQDVKAKVGNLTKALGFESTIGDTRQFWSVVIPKENPFLYMPGEAGGLFKQRLQVQRIPTDDEKPHATLKTIRGTYVEDPIITIRANPDVKLSTKDFFIEPDKSTKSLYNWKFKAQDRGEINRSYLLVESPEGPFETYYELYKGYPRELSTRLTGILSSSGGYVFMGELAFNYWFEDLFGWRNYHLSTQRWGTSIKAFRTFSEFTVGKDSDDEDVKATLEVQTVDLKYRLTPGLWGRDESWGLILSYQGVGFQDIKGALVGGGFFWARSMPRVFDDLFNLLPFMNYPKWVDLEFITYASSLTSTLKPDVNYALNFHGKVLWTKSFFGEAGFGMKQYAFTDTEQNQEAKFATFYGTVGLGLNF